MPLEQHFPSQNDDSVRCSEVKYHRYFPINVCHSITLNFRIISTDSVFDQAILILLPRNFLGEVRVNNKRVPVKKGSFPKVNFWTATSPTEFSVSISNYCGEIKICNGSDPLGTRQICRHLSDGCAMLIEEVDANRYRFRCNDHELDDDYNDLVFEVSCCRNVADIV